jgi:predicted phosphodiesterase
MRIAVISDIHANLPALEAVLADVERAGPDLIVVGGDVAGGPMPVETLDRLAELGDRARFVLGNGDRDMVAGHDGTLEPDEDAFHRATAWATAQLERRHRDLLAAYEPTISLDVDGLGPTLFCHGSPRSEDEMITVLTPAERLAPMVHGVRERVIVGGHTHRQFDRRLLDRRIVNAGSVGMPYEGVAGAFWVLLGPDVELRRTDYDVAAAAATLRATGFPGIDEIMLRESLLEPTDPDVVAAYFEGL